jgi:aldehyde dehydrogenase (NAD+)
MSSKVMSDEIFGPIMPVIKIKDMNEAINIVKTMDKPLSMYIFSKTSKNIDLLIKNIQSGGVLVNDTLFHFANAYIPFGGVGPSGLGGYHGKFSIECFSHRRSIMRRDDHMILDIPIRYPPYKENALIVFKIASKLPGIPSIPIIKSFFIKTIALGVFSACIVYATNKFGWTIPIDL